LVAEGVRSTLDFADVRTFDTGGGDLDGLLRSVRPDALIVDSAAAAADAVEFASEHDLPILHVAVREPALRLYVGGAWRLLDSGDGPAEVDVRNVLAGALFASERA
jgi:hypothetical protein